MPKELHDKLEKEYKNLPKDERDAAVYGTMSKIDAAKKKRHSRRKKRGR